MAGLIEVAELDQTIETAVLIEASLSDDIKSSLDKFDASHLPGALFADRNIWARDPEIGEGRNPLPKQEKLQEDVRTLGLSLDSEIVLYDRFKNVYATRAAWVLQNAGFKNVRVLNGGYNLWISQIGKTESGKTVASAPSKVTIEWGLLPKIEAEDALAFPENGILIDARNADRYAGVPDPKDPRSGHIPGARNLPWETLYDASGRFHEAEKLRLVFADLGVTGDQPIAAYCGSGISATYIITALERAGLSTAALYPGSWSEWGANPKLPISTEQNR